MRHRRKLLRAPQHPVTVPIAAIGLVAGAVAGTFVATMTVDGGPGEVLDAALDDLPWSTDRNVTPAPGSSSPAVTPQPTVVTAPPRPAPIGAVPFARRESAAPVAPPAQGSGASEQGETPSTSSPTASDPAVTPTDSPIIPLPTVTVSVSASATVTVPPLPTVSVTPTIRPPRPPRPGPPL